MMENPFTLSFGKKPIQYISRIVQTDQIVESFSAEQPPTQVYMVAGVRGSGKTVLMSTIADIFREQSDFIVIELNSSRDMLQSLAAKLYAIPDIHAFSVKARLDFSVFGLGFSIEGAPPITDIEDVVGKLLEQLARMKKRLLLLVDEVVKNEYVKVFTSAFQIFIRQNYPIFLLMTGLYDNIYDLQNDKSLTFLYRAPKIFLDPLNYTAVKKCYMDIFHITPAEASDMTNLTKGYPFAFQVLGYLYWGKDKKQTLSDIVPAYSRYLEEYVYEKIWTESSELDRKIMTELSLSGAIDVKTLRNRLAMSSGLFSVYRERLKRKGVIDTRSYGKISLILPQFDEFVKLMTE